MYVQKYLTILESLWITEIFWLGYTSDQISFLYLSILEIFCPPVEFHLWYHIKKSRFVAEKAIRIIHGVNPRVHSESFLVHFMFFLLAMFTSIISDSLWAIVIWDYCQIFFDIFEKKKNENKNSNIHVYDISQWNLLYMPCLWQVIIIWKSATTLLLISKWTNVSNI